MDDVKIQQLAILGSTGSIGQSALEVVRVNSQVFNVFALAAKQNRRVLLQQCMEFKPSYVVLEDEQQAKLLEQELSDAKLKINVLAGVSAIDELASNSSVNIVIAGIVGVAGLSSTLSAINAGKKVLLANKESLVCAGSLLMSAVRANNAELIALDSEHNAMFQCFSYELQHRCSKGQSLANHLEKVILTASGGPFLNTPVAQLYSVTPEQACAHPNWKMGQKISIDSATMMNKGLEYIEACWLFGINYKQIEVVIHPQSVIHSLVEYSDGSLLAQLGCSDMQVPISYALGWPKRIASNSKKMNFHEIGTLEFQQPSFEHFPCLQLAMDCQQNGQQACIIMNVANEVCVEAFLNRRIRFTQIYEFVAKTLDFDSGIEPNSLEEVIELCNFSKTTAKQLLSAF